MLNRMFKNQVISFQNSASFNLHSRLKVHDRRTQQIILEFSGDYFLDKRLNSSKVLSKKISVITTASCKVDKSKIN